MVPAGARGPPGPRDVGHARGAPLLRRHSPWPPRGWQHTQGPPLGKQRPALPSPSTPGSPLPAPPTLEKQKAAELRGAGCRLHGPVCPGLVATARGAASCRRQWRAQGVASASVPPAAQAREPSAPKPGGAQPGEGAVGAAGQVPPQFRARTPWALAAASRGWMARPWMAPGAPRWAVPLLLAHDTQGLSSEVPYTPQALPKLAQRLPWGQDMWPRWT